MSMLDSIPEIVGTLLSLNTRLMAGLRTIRFLDSPLSTEIVDELERDYLETLDALMEKTKKGEKEE